MSKLPLYLKLFNAVYKFITDKQGDIPVFHGNDIPDFIQASKHDDIVRNRAISYQSKKYQDDFLRDLMSDDKISMSSFGLLIDGKLVKEYYCSPYSPKFRHVAYSVSKTIVALAVGLAVDEGKLCLTDKVFDYFPSHSNIFPKKGMKQITVEHLLTMTAGVNFNELESYFSYDWCRDFFSSTMKFSPGTGFYYNSMNSYILMALLTKVLDENPMEYLNRKLFFPMGITDITWDKCPKGIEKGGWGVKLSLIDSLKLGQLILNKGVWSVGKRITPLISEEWINKILELHVPCNGKNLKGYGYGIWLLKDGAYLYNGMFGQNIYINPTYNMVIAIFSSAGEVFPDGPLVDRIISFVNGNYIPKKNTSIQKNKIIEYYASKNTKKYLSPYFGNVYRFQHYAGSILPLSSQLIYSNFLSGIDKLSISMKDERLLLKVKDSGETFVINIGYKTGYKYQLIKINGKYMPIASLGKVYCDDKGRRFLKIHIVFLEEIGNKILKLYFDEDEIRLSSDETPDLTGFLEKLLGEDKIKVSNRLKEIQTKDYFMYKLNKIISPRAKGYLDD